MPKRSQLVNFAVRFGLIFCLLVIPWPGLREGYAHIFQLESRALIKVALPATGSSVGGATESGQRWADTRIVLNPSGETTVERRLSSRTVLLDSRSLGWMPLAMMLAMIGATPLIQRHLWHALLAFGLVNMCIGLTVVMAVCHALYPLESSGWRGWIFLFADHLLVENLWTSFVIPALAWFGLLMPRLNAKIAKAGGTTA